MGETLALQRGAAIRILSIGTGAVKKGGVTVKSQETSQTNTRWGDWARRTDRKLWTHKGEAEKVEKDGTKKSSSVGRGRLKKKQWPLRKKKQTGKYSEKNKDARRGGYYKKKRKLKTVRSSRQRPHKAEKDKNRGKNVESETP